jgi:hypothetical protein
MRAVLAISLVGCAASPHYASTTPPPLASTEHHDGDEVRIEVRPSQWYDTDHVGGAFILAFPAPHAPPTPGRSLGAVRSDDIAFDTADTMRCAWQVVPMGDDRPCSGISRVDAMTEVQPAIHRAFDELRARAGQAGATVVIGVSCYTTFAQPHLWCEGTALLPDPQRPDRVEVDPSEPTTAEPELATNRLALAADGGVTLFGSQFARTASFALRYRPLSFAWELAALNDGRFAIGASALWRFALPGAPGLDAILGGEASAVAPNNSTNPEFHGLYEAFTGVTYQSSWKIEGKAQPYVQLRVGAAHGHDLFASPTEPVFGLAIGLSSPER